MSFSGDPSVKIVTRPPHLALAQDVRCDKRRHRDRYHITQLVVHLAVMRLHNNTNKTHDIEVNADETHSAILTTLTEPTRTGRGQHQLSSDQTARHRHHRPFLVRLRALRAAGRSSRAARRAGRRELGPKRASSLTVKTRCPRKRSPKVGGSESRFGLCPLPRIALHDERSTRATLWATFV